MKPLHGRSGLFMVFCSFLTCLAFNHVVQAAGSSGQTAQPGVPLYDNLGALHHTISTKNKLAQKYFDQGLRLTYGFNHAEAIRAYTEAARLDPQCAICYWGVALDYGPNINLPMDADSGVKAYAAVQQALALLPNASTQEQDYIRAVATRYVVKPEADRTALDRAYADAMGRLAAKYPDDLDAQTLYAESLMDLQPWEYWTHDGKPQPGTLVILTTLENVIQRNPNHPGACHYYIHAVEAAYPEKAVPCADRLASLMPGAGHLVHMPAHIYIRVGRWADAIKANEHAVHTDETYIMDQHPAAGMYPMGYYPHNIHFLGFAASMAGNSAMTLESARKLAGKVDPGMMTQIGLLQTMMVMPLQAEIRFGHWQEVLAEPAPPAALHYPTGVWHYARGVAYATQGNLNKADAELAELQKMMADPAMTTFVVDTAGNTAASVLQIASRVLAGEIAAKRDATDAAVSYFTQAAELEDRFVYIEPPNWPLPVRQQFGAVLMANGRASEAEAVYRADLARFPENGWSLYGLAASLRAQGKTAEADAVQARFKRAWTLSDVILTASVF
jgi:tetratricopeptide (TPR) repeat protein